MVIVHASPGFMVIRMRADGSERSHPVVAWEIGEDGFCHPITTEPLCDQKIQVASGLIHPDGHVTTAYGEQFVDLETWRRNASGRLSIEEAS